MNGASIAAVSSRQWRRVAKAARSPSQKRRRESRTYQLESSSTKSAIAWPAAVQSKASMRSRTVATVACRRESAQRSRSSPGSRRAGEVGGAEPLGVRVEDPEGVGVPEGEEELADRLADGVDREAVARPGLLGGQVVPAEGVGAVGGDHVPGLDHVALALRHLLALGVEDQAEADAVAVAGGVEEQGRLGEQRVEPAAGLVDRLADEVGGEALLELLLVLERVVELREGHRAAVVPGVDHRLDPAHLPPALLAVEDHLVYIWAVQVLGHLAAGALAQLGDRAGAEAAVAVLAARTPRSAAASPSSGRGRAPSRRCSPAICRSGRA